MASKKVWRGVARPQVAMHSQLLRFPVKDIVFSSSPLLFSCLLLWWIELTNTDVSQFHTSVATMRCYVTTSNRKVFGSLAATCVSYADDVNNSMLRMRGHVSAGFFRCDVLFLHGKQNTTVFVILLHVREVDFLNALLVSSQFATDSKMSLYALATMWRKPLRLPRKIRTSQRQNSWRKRLTTRAV